mgnify:CR=1 FL=1
MHEIRLIHLPKDRYAIVDKDDYDELNKYKWQFCNGYASRLEYVEGKRKSVKMHRVIMGNPSNDIDHINLDRLDNRKDNLRECIHDNNMHNRPKYRNNTSGYKGVSFHKGGRKWAATIGYNSKLYHLGSFTTPEEAAEAYNIAAITLHGEFARINEGI